MVPDIKQKVFFSFAHSCHFCSSNPLHCTFPEFLLKWILCWKVYSSSLVMFISLNNFIHLQLCPFLISQNDLGFTPANSENTISICLWEPYVIGLSHMGGSEDSSQKSVLNCHLTVSKNSNPVVGLCEEAFVAKPPHSLSHPSYPLLIDPMGYNEIVTLHCSRSRTDRSLFWV